jgi:hypothetical protein
MICLTQRLYSIEDRKIEGLKQQLLFQLSHATSVQINIHEKLCNHQNGLELAR